ncbi:MAG: hypothetical protein ACOC0P_01490 [Planctomycetota bacterium]
MAVLVALAMITGVLAGAAANDANDPPDASSQAESSVSAASPTGSASEEQPSDADAASANPDPIGWRATIEQSAGSDEQRSEAAYQLLKSSEPDALAYAARTVRTSERRAVLAAFSTAVQRLQDNAGGVPAAVTDALLPAFADRLGSAPVPADSNGNGTGNETGGAGSNPAQRALSAFPADAVVPLLQSRLADSTRAAAERLAAIGALSSFPRTDAADALVAATTDELPEIRAAARDALSMLIGAPAETDWSTWWDGVRERGREGLLEEIARHMTARSTLATESLAAAERERTQLVSELVDAMEQQYRLLSHDQRAPMLGRYLAHRRSEVRRLGLDLVQQELSNAVPITPAVKAAVFERLEDSNATVRAAALRTAFALNGSRSAEFAAARLGSESAPAPRREMLAILSKFPHEAATEALIDALAVPAERPRAAESLFVAAERGLLSPDERGRATSALMLQLPPELQQPAASADDAGEPSPADAMLLAQLRPDEIALLAWSTDAPARSLVERALDLRIPPASGVDPDHWRILRTAAARGLVASGVNDAALLQHADDPEIYPYVAAGVAAHAPDLSGLEQLLGLPATVAADHVRAVDSIMLALNPADWLAADDLLRSAGDRTPITAVQRAEWLSPAIDLPIAQAAVDGSESTGSGDSAESTAAAPSGSNEEAESAAKSPNGQNSDGLHHREAMAIPADLKQQLCLRLAEIEWSLGRVESVITAIAAVQDLPVKSPELQAPMRDLYAAALIAGGRFTEVPADAPASAWLDALACRSAGGQAEDPDLAQRILTTIEARRNADPPTLVLDEADAARLAEFTAEPSAVPTTPPAAEQPGPESASSSSSAPAPAAEAEPSALAEAGGHSSDDAESGQQEQAEASTAAGNGP